MKYINRIFLGSPSSGTGVRGEEGAELLEYALVLPLLLVLLIGLLDFAMAYNIKQKLSNAAREGARLGSSQPLSDLAGTSGCNASPPSITIIHDAVVSYLNDNGINTSFIGGTESQSGCSWSWYSSGTYGLLIQRPVLVAVSGGGSVGTTQVTLVYPYNWLFGFNNVIKLLIPSASIAGTVPIPVNAILQDLG